MTRIRINVKEGPDVTGRRVDIPDWLADRDKPAPCFCGERLRHGEPYITAESNYGLKRWFHAHCFQAVMDDGWVDPE